MIHFLDEGPRDAPALAFVNALGCDLRIWDEVSRVLGRDYRIIRYDKRGHGLSESGPDTNDIADYAADLAGLIDQLGVGRATIVGLSIGGLIAQELFRLHPSLVAKLVLCDTGAKVGTDESWDARIAEIRRGGIELIADFDPRQVVHGGLPRPARRRIRGMRAMLTRTAEQGYLAACGALKRADFRAQARGIAVPTLCLVGEADGSTPVAVVRELADLIQDFPFRNNPRRCPFAECRAARRRGGAYFRSRPRRLSAAIRC